MKKRKVRMSESRRNNRHVVRAKKARDVAREGREFDPDETESSEAVDLHRRRS